MELELELITSEKEEIQVLQRVMDLAKKAKELVASPLKSWKLRLKTMERRLKTMERRLKKKKNNYLGIIIKKILPNLNR